MVQHRPLSLVTGACGFMGSHMVEVLTEAGHRVRATDIPQAFVKSSTPNGRYVGVLHQCHAELMATDLTRPDNLAALVEGVDYVFHVAGLFNYSVPLETLRRVNVVGTQHLLGGFEQRKPKKMVLWGAGGLYDVPSIPEKLPFDESCPIKPANDYLLSKQEQEDLATGVCQRNGIPLAIVRPFMVYGPRAVYGSGLLMNDLLKMKTVRIPCNFTFHMATAHVRDVCRAALFLAERESLNGFYNIVDPSECSMVEFFETAARVLGKPFKPAPGIPVSVLRPLLVGAAYFLQGVHRLVGGKPPKLEPATMKYLGVDFHVRPKKLLESGFQFEFPGLEEGLRNTLEWYRVGQYRMGGDSNIYH